LETRIEDLLLPNGTDRLPFIIVRRIDERVVRKLQEAVEDRIELSARIAVLEIGAPSTADEEGIAGEHAVRHGEGVRIVGVAGRVDDIEAQALDLNLIAVVDTHGDDIGLSLVAHDRHAGGAVAQRAESGDVVSMKMGVYGLHQTEIELIQKLDIAVDLLQNRIDDESFAALAACE
jgi:hypothetical protein